ncbi:regulatory protein RecX [Ekhidna sp.]|uniref:regulatory protein RecX n=1 Tax=Ekhidna sp. TaxID=2608089 RepID=UPI003CCBDBCA
MPGRLGIKEAKQRAGRFCAFRERSPNELFEKLQSWGLPEDQASEVLSELSKEGFVDEQRFANAFCNDKFQFNSWGKQKIKAHIYSHKLPEVIVTNALNRIDPDQYENRLFELAETKWQSLERETDRMKRKQKTVNYLANKGFEMDLIWTAINKLEERL